jgi:hypothetical protein
VSERVEYLKRKVILSVGEDVKQVQTVTCIADVASALGGKYFYLYSAEDAVKYAVWIDVDNLSTPPVLTGVTLIEANITAGASATAVAIAVASAIDAEADFVATSNLAVVTITNAAFGYATSATEFNSGFAFALVTEGQQLATDSAYVKVFSKLGDGLFSSDDDLRKYEPDILKWCPKGRSSFLDIHRQVQREILDYLDRNGYVDVYRKKFTKWAIKDVTEVNEWARFMALRIIFGGINNSKDDVFIKKSDSYLEKEITARQRAILRLDVDGTGTVEDDEGIDPYSIKLGFR